ncbi:Ribonuclease P protein component [invertebrate metagenome]|uniref:Ribonuclease P protein component n=1 Tax=invertebrate metagenome TaxID=1711999 RepID=A0A2H9T914_9ZZZZ
MFDSLITTGAVNVDFVFSRKMRLCLASDFRQVFNQTEIKVSCKQLLILARRNNRQYPRLGLIVAKKHIHMATARNRTKRYIRETFRIHQDKLDSLDVVVLIRKGAKELSGTEMYQLLNCQWQRLNRYSQTAFRSDKG